ncbi:BON domain-containing protein [bacterium M00.F.Ca.ET.228.01.1.1]|uniref:BON domain-containing protein n=1 Tax=Paraburkholderia phenoliruptrix TaxID=252970 RepID=UPI001092D903|nr:BON domain-containing protein [Paraburkholderia phenoliruptrix]TGP42648.1 BON domain-containing protein [bacterium M00.F.Ca.ET.228.01.1.1]TGR95373.1 BON domain-containing protein [bacterium M00.F.Ca.ET.191.01.1.1]TGT96262.1 BON domain-containing protein [bacterium M00.F.Ca.ET.155.01.1.1]MBW0447443.1 BON domain-containing protein [Paraburkholderia phenoliruptrix]MBW9098877.1 BON domain-containing protein [Paraburkholderia phenoliruptrix]
MKSDFELKRQVEEELAWDPAVDSTDIGVEVRDRIVTLSGHPSSYAEKLAAEKAAQRVAGVKAVVVEMSIRLPHADVRTDEEIANAVRTMMRWTVGLNEEAVKVQVEKGWVTLSGEVDRAYQSHVATRTISHMRGVTGVSNLIRIGGQAAAQDIGEQIGKALQRHAEREARHIEVKVHEGTVTLTGKVGSAAERWAVRGAAWSAPGVHAVVDDLTVA